MKITFTFKQIISTVMVLVALAFGQTAQAMVTEPMTFDGYSNTNGNTSLHVWRIQGFLGMASSQQPVSGTSQTFDNVQVINVGGNRVTINGTLNFTVTNTFTDVYTGSVVTLVFESSHFWFYGATVKTLSDANVTGCTYSTSSNKNTITVTIPQGKTFGKVYLDFVPNAPMTNSNTTVTVPDGDYWVSDANHKPMPMPTVTYGNTTLTQGTDYTLSWSNNGSAGTGTVTVTGGGNYTGSATGTFPIRWATYTIHFDKNHNDATGTMSDQQFTYHTAQNLTANAFSRTGCSFEGWSTTPNGAVAYTDQQSVNNLSVNDGEIINLYAKWTLTNYHITYDLDGGSVAITNPNTYWVTTPTFTLNNPTQPGFTFDGWTGTDLAEPTQTVTIAQGSTGDRSYTANWTRFAYVLVLENGITATPSPAATYNSIKYYTPGTEITLSYNGTPPSGLDFLGFYVNGSPIEGNTFVMPANDVTVTINFNGLPWEGAGTSDYPYIILNADQLDMLATRLNTGIGDDYASNGYSGKYFKLGADINYNPNELINGENYTAIGNYDGNEDYQFKGTFDGDNHIISGIRINKPDYSLQGLFGTIAYSGTVKNVILDDAVVIGSNFVGGIAGNKLGTIENCRVINTNITGNSLVGGIAGGSANPKIENNLVLNTAITYDNTENYNCGGAIIGSQQTGYIGDNYYHNCTLNGVASNIGCGVASIGNMIVGDITWDNAAVQAYTLSLSPHITATPVANATYDGILYYTEGTEITLGSKDGYTITSATLIYGGNNYNIEPIGGVYSFTMPAADVSVTVMEISSDRYQLFTGNLVEGDYLIVYNLKGNLYSMNNVISNHAFQYEVVNAIDNVITTDNADIVWHIAPYSDGNWTIYNAAIGKYAGGRLTQSGAQLYDETDYCATWTVGSSYSFQNCDDRFLGFRTYHTTIIGFCVMDLDSYNPIYTNLLLYKKVEAPITETYTLEIEGYNDDESGWYLIASPISTPITLTEGEGILTNDYDLYRFNQSGANGEWENYKAHPEFTTLVNGQGYLYANSEDVTLSFIGIPYSGYGTVTLDKDDNADLSGWNLVGNPFAETAYIDRDFYYVMNDGCSEIIVAERSNNYVEAMEGIFVHADEDGETMTFTTEAPIKGSGNNESLVINLSNGNRSSVIDRAIVCFDGKNTLPKLQIFDGSTKLYIPQEGTDYAMVSSDRQSDIPLNFKAKEFGKYTINFNGTDMNNIKLIDKFENLVINLNKNNTYTFVGSPSDRQERFIITFDGSEHFESSDNSIFAYQSGTDIIVNGEGELQIFDVMGRMIMQKHIDGVETWRAASLQTGVYILKLNEETQKIIIK